MVHLWVSTMTEPNGLNTQVFQIHKAVAGVKPVVLAPGAARADQPCRQDALAFAESSATARRAASVRPPSVCVCCFAHSMIFSATNLRALWPAIFSGNNRHALSRATSIFATTLSSNSSAIMVHPCARILFG